MTMLNVLNPAIENISRTEIKEIQLQRLLAQLNRCMTDIPFYRERWPEAAAGITSFEEFREIMPFTSKPDFISGLPQETGRLSAGSDIFQNHVTSGTTGLGQEVHPVSTTDHEALGAAWQYQAHWSGMRPGDIIAYTWPIGLQTGGLSTPVTAQRLGLIGIQLGPYSSEDKLRYMEKFQPQALVASPSYITHLSHLLSRSGRTPAEVFPTMKALFIAGESYSVAWAEQTMQGWGCKVSEWYGLMQTAMNLAFSCEESVVSNGVRGRLHCFDHRFYTEILHPGTKTPVKVGESGEIVVTTLTKDAFPVVRFRTGDRATLLTDECPCGRPFMSIEAGTIARYDDMMKVRGQNLWPEAVDKVVLSDPLVAEYAGEVSIDDHGRETIVVRYELIADPESAEEEASIVHSLQHSVKSATNITMQFERVPALTLQRFEFKARRWVDRRREDRTFVQYVAKS